MMIATEQSLEDLTLTINQEIHVKASMDATFAALLEQLGPGNELDGGTLINFRHTALGFVSEEHKAGMTKGWNSMHDRVRKQAEAGR
jgi:hypothetical protein